MRGLAGSPSGCRGVCHDHLPLEVHQDCLVRNFEGTTGQGELVVGLLCYLFGLGTNVQPVGIVGVHLELLPLEDLPQVLHAGVPVVLVLLRGLERPGDGGGESAEAGVRLLSLVLLLLKVALPLRVLKVISLYGLQHREDLVDHALLHFLREQPLDKEVLLFHHGANALLKLGHGSVVLGLAPGRLQECQEDGGEATPEQGATADHGLQVH